MLCNILWSKLFASAVYIGSSGATLHNLWLFVINCAAVHKLEVLIMIAVDYPLKAFNDVPKQGFAN